MNDKLLRGPINISIDITNECNLRCLHCYNSSGENVQMKNELSDEQLLNILDDIIELEPMSICFCGGEPLLRKNVLIKLIKKARANNIMASMVTNGILLDENFAKELKLADVTQVQISIDGINESHDKLRGWNSFEKSVKALQNLKDNSITSTVAFSPTSWNIKDFKGVVDLCLEKSVKKLRVQALMPMGRGSVNQDYIMPTNEQYRELRKVMIDCENNIIKSCGELDIEWGDPIEHLINLPKYKALNFTVSIRADGSITPSIYLPLSVGNLKKHSLSQYWKNGLNDIWSMQELLDMASMYRSVIDLDGKEHDLPETFLEDDIYIDIMEKCN